MTGLESKFKGCIIGTAIGDAYGEPFEGFLRPQIERVGNLNSKYRGRYTDDTQLTLAIANSLIESKGFNIDNLIKHFINWLYEPPIGPGYGCLKAIHNLAKGLRSPSNSGGNGTAMRVSPIGLFYCKEDQLNQLKEYAKESSLLTHDHWAATAGSIIIARAIAYVVNKNKIDRYDFIDTLSTFIDEPEFKQLSIFLKELKGYFDIPAKDALKDLGLKGVESPFIEIFDDPMIKGKGVISGYTIPTVLCAIYTFLLTPEDFLKSITEVILAGGDTDTTAAICGAISGTYNGYEKLPEFLINGLKDKQRIISIAENLYKTFIEYNK
ncbi:MAG: ADP-ribosylglycohydrolase family protein [Candidatus Helarchaeota archaeon]